MIIFDTETTSLVTPSVTALDQQVRMIEFAAIRVNDETLEQENEWTFLLNPGIPLQAEIIKVTKLTDEILKSQRKFSSCYPTLCEFFLGETTLVAHNAAFDVAVIDAELKRIGKERNFPWPKDHICTIERTQDIMGKRLKLSDLYLHLYGEEPTETTHRAMGDVRILYKCVIKLKEMGRL